MKWELDDNARSGFHYLMLGVVVVGFPSLVIFLIDLWQTVNVTADIHKLQVFRNGYLLGDPTEVTATFTSRGERIATAVLLAFLCGGSVSGLLWLVGLRTHHWAAGRWTATALFIYFVYAAVAIPQRKCTVSRNEVVMTQHLCIPFCDLPLPFSRRIDTLTFGPNREVYSLLHEDGRTWRVFLHDAHHESEIAISRADSLSVVSGVGYLNRLASVQ
jgi:hypothetical protein